MLGRAVSGWAACRRPQNLQPISEQQGGDEGLNCPARLQAQFSMGHCLWNTKQCSETSRPFRNQALIIGILSSPTRPDKKLDRGETDPKLPRGTCQGTSSLPTPTSHPGFCAPCSPLSGPELYQHTFQSGLRRPDISVTSPPRRFTSVLRTMCNSSLSRWGPSAEHSLPRMGSGLARLLSL